VGNLPGALPVAKKELVTRPRMLGNKVAGPLDEVIANNGIILDYQAIVGRHVMHLPGQTAVTPRAEPLILIVDRKRHVAQFAPQVREPLLAALVGHYDY